MTHTNYLSMYIYKKNLQIYSFIFIIDMNVIDKDIINNSGLGSDLSLKRAGQSGRI